MCIVHECAHDYSLGNGRMDLYILFMHQGVYMYLWMYVCMNVCMCICMDVCMLECMCICMCV